LRVFGGFYFAGVLFGGWAVRTPPMGRKLLRPKNDRIHYKELFFLCRTLNCTPNDLFVLDEREKKLLPPDHPLLQIKPRTGKINLLDKLRQLPLDKLDDLERFIDGKE